MKDRFDDGLKSAQKAVLRKLPLKKASSINALAKMAGMDAADIYQCSAEEVQHELAARIVTLRARRVRPLKVDLATAK